MSSFVVLNDRNIRYVREKRSKRLQDCANAISQYEAKIQEHGLEIEQIRKTVAKLDKEINEGGAALANLRENRRLRKLQSSIQATQKEINSCDIEGASKAKRNFEEKFQPEKDRESEMQQRVPYPSLPPCSFSPSALECSHRWRVDFVESPIAKTRGGSRRV